MPPARLAPPSPSLPPTRMLPLSRRPNAVAAQYRELFNTPVERLLELRDALAEQMEAGLEGKVGGRAVQRHLACLVTSRPP